MEFWPCWNVCAITTSNDGLGLAHQAAAAQLPAMVWTALPCCLGLLAWATYLKKTLLMLITTTRKLLLQSCRFNIRGLNRLGDYYHMHTRLD